MFSEALQGETSSESHLRANKILLNCFPIIVVQAEGDEFERG